MADFGNTSVFSQTDALNNGVVQPFWRGSQAANLIDESGQAFQGAVTREWYRGNVTMTSTGSSNAYVVTYTISPVALYTGQKFNFIANFTNTSTATLTINSFTAAAIKKMASGTLVDIGAGDITTGHPIEVYYNGTYFVLLAASGAGNGVPVVTSKTLLAALNPNAAPYVDLATTYDEDRFKWTAGDLSAAVTADPGKGRYIASTVSGYGSTVGAYTRITRNSLNPKAFDARSGSGLDDTTALQRWADVISNERIDNANWDGEFSFSGTTGIVWGPSSGDCLTKRVTGRMKLSAMTGSTGDFMFKMRNNANARIGSLELLGLGGAAYSGRASKFANGLELDNVTRLLMDSVVVSALYGYGVSQPNTPSTENNNFNQINFIKAYDCGSGHVSDTYTGTLQGTFSSASIVNTGGDSFSQISKFTTATLPPQVLSTLSSVIPPMFVRAGGRYYTITAVDYGLTTISVFPQLDPLLTGTVPFSLVFGGGLLTQGSDSNVIITPLTDFTRCGIGYTAAALYSSGGGFLNASSCGAGLVIGATGGGAINGGSIKGYFESNVSDVVLVTRATQSVTNFRIECENTLDLAKIPNIRQYRTTATGLLATGTAADRMYQLTLVYDGKELWAEKPPFNIEETTGSIALSFLDNPRFKVVQHMTPTIAVTAPEFGINQFAGIDDYQLQVMGTAAGGGAPTSVTFTVPATLTTPFTADATTDILTPSTSTPPIGMGLCTGVPVTFTTTTTLPAPLALATTYYLIRREGDDRYKVATSLANANAGTAIDITTAGTGTHTFNIPSTLNGGTSSVVFNTFTAGKAANFSLKYKMKESNLVVTLI